MRERADEGGQGRKGKGSRVAGRAMRVARARARVRARARAARVARAMGHPCWPGASFDPPPEGFCDVVGTGDKQPIVVNNMGVDADLVTEVQCTSLVRPPARCSLHCARR
jgi:hypothetical protein